MLKPMPTPRGVAATRRASIDALLRCPAAARLVASVWVVVFMELAPIVWDLATAARSLELIGERLKLCDVDSPAARMATALGWRHEHDIPHPRPPLPAFTRPEPRAG